MAKIIPKLNLNKHYRDAENNSIIDATNIMVSNDYFTLQTEVGTKLHNIINNAISEKLGDTYTVVYAIPCNKEIVFFVKVDNEDCLNLFRYNEDENKCYFIINNFEYYGGTLVGTFTYNYNNLIIAVSEHSGSQDVPLRVINLGKFNETSPVESEIDKPQLEDNTYHAICPEVIIPTVITELQSGHSYKGWYYIFIRYKTGTNNYTQWFNTNESVYIDSFDTKKLINYYISADANTSDELNVTFNGYTDTVVSDEKDLCSISFNCNIQNLDSKYKYYQLGFICISKTYTKAFVSNDIDTSLNTFIFGSDSVNDYTALELVKNYYNYYNIKTIDNYNNRLYIANYEEANNDLNIDTSSLTLNIKQFNNIVDITTSEVTNETQTRYYFYKDENKKELVYVCTLSKSSDNTPIEYFVFNEIIWYRRNKDINNTAIKFNLANTQTIQVLWEAIHSDDSDWFPDLYEDYLVNEIVYFKNNDDEWYLGTYKNNIFTAFGSSKNVNGSNYNFGGIVYNNIIYHCRTAGYFANGEWESKKINISQSTINTNINQLSNIAILPNNYYNFYIHFVDKYGIVSKGIQINKLTINIDNDSKIEQLTNDLGYILLKPCVDWINGDSLSGNENSSFIQTYLQFKLDGENLPNGYTGYFFSYEKLEKTILYTAVANGVLSDIKLYNDRFNYDDVINFNFNKINIKEGNFEQINDTNTATNINYNVNYKYLENEYIIYPKTNKLLNVADSFNNLLQSTNIRIAGDSEKTGDSEETDVKSINYQIAIIENNINLNKLYTKEIKELIPCSSIIYELNKYIKINTKNCFITNQHAIVFKDNIFYNNAVKYYQETNSNKPNNYPLTHYVWYYWDDQLHESIQYNNKPVVTMFPITGLNTDSTDYDKSFEIGSIVEVKNTIDLYQQKQVAIYDLYPKVLDYYNPKLKYINNFNNTIRRSNVIQDESSNISWRNFETDNYTNINENKGSITKITGIGSNMIVHTEHSLFLFNSDNSLKTNKDENVQLANVDIWDINYKEVLTSKLGYAGLNKEHQAIVGEFGYIFYSQDDDKIYRFDNGNLKRIDEKIINYLKDFKVADVRFVDDKTNNRLLLSLTSKQPMAGAYTYKTLSYNYLMNDFISTHSYMLYPSYSTKNKIYLLSINNKVSSFYTIDDIGGEETFPFYNKRLNYEGVYHTLDNAKISILYNVDYESIKILEAIKYKLYNINEFGKINYSGDIVDIKSEFCNTGEFDFENKLINYDQLTGIINYKKLDSTTEYIINEFNDYTKPYFRLGNWHFNYIRNKILNNDKLVDNESTLVYGNYFIITFKFANNKLIELDSIDYKLNKDLI